VKRKSKPPLKELLSTPLHLGETGLKAKKLISGKRIIQGIVEKRERLINVSEGKEER